MKRILPLFIFLLLLAVPALADTANLQLVFNTNGTTGQAANVRVVITDNAGNVLVAATNTPGSLAFAESTVIPGEYNAPATVTYTPANLPLRGEFYIAGSSPLVFAATVYLTERASEIAAGYTAALPGALTTGQAAITAKTNLIATNAADSPNAVTAQTGISQANTTLAAINTQTNSSTRQADMIAALTAQGYTVTRSAKLDNLDTNIGSRLATAGYTAPPTVSQIASGIMAYSMAGTTYQDIIVNSASVLFGAFSITHPTATSQVTQYNFNNLPTVQTNLTTTTAGAPVSKTTTLTNQ